MYYVAPYNLVMLVTSTRLILQQEYKVDMVNSDPDSGVTLLNKFLSQLEEKIRDFLPLSHTK